MVRHRDGPRRPRTGLGRRRAENGPGRGMGGAWHRRVCRAGLSGAAGAVLAARAVVSRGLACGPAASGAPCLHRDDYGGADPAGDAGSCAVRRIGGVGVAVADRLPAAVRGDGVGAVALVEGQ